MNIPAPSSPVIPYFLATPPNQAKHIRLREAIISAIQDGALAVGQKLQGERELSIALGLSLGTTQKALGRLVAEGFLDRRHGHGTFVGSQRRAVHGAWHFRFLPSEGGEEMPLFTTVTGRCITKETGFWAGALGPDKKGYVRIDRWIDVGGRFGCATQIYLAASRFNRLLRIPESKLTDSNLKTVLEEEFGAPTFYAQGFLKAVSLPAADARLLGVAAGSPGMHVDIVATGLGHAPLSFQRVQIPATDYVLKVDFYSP